MPESWWASIEEAARAEADQTLVQSKRAVEIETFKAEAARHGERADQREKKAQAMRERVRNATVCSPRT